MKLIERINKIPFYDKAVLGLILGNLFILVVLSQYRHIGSYGVETDFYGAYAPQAANLRASKPYTYTRLGPGYPLVLAVTSLFIPDMFNAAMLISIVSSTLFIYFTFHIFKCLFSERCAFLTAALLTLNLAPYSLAASTEMFTAFLVSASIFSLVRSPSMPRNNLFVSGSLAGYAYITRYNCIALLFAVWFALPAINPTSNSLRTRLGKSILFSAGFVLISSPWFLTNYLLNGSPFYSSNYTQIASTFFGRPGDLSGITLELMRHKFSTLGDVLLYNPKFLIYQYLKHSVYYLGYICEEIIEFPGYLFAGVGLILLYKNITRLQLVYLSVCAFSYLILCLVWFVPRFYLFMYPLFFFLVVYPFCPDDASSESAMSRVVGRLKYGKVPAAILVVLFASSLVKQTVVYKNMFSSEPRSLSDVAGFLRSREKDRRAGIIARKPHIAYLSGMTGSFPIDLEMSLDEFEKFAIERRMKYVFFSDRDAAISPVLKKFENPSVMPPSIKLVYENTGPYLGRIYLYELSSSDLNQGKILLPQE